MIRLTTSFYCTHCDQVRRFSKRGLNPHQHLIATILTAGFWGIVWLVLHYRAQRRAWRCCVCRGRHRPVPDPRGSRQLAEERPSLTVAQLPAASE
jgi:hypothetical protein